MPDVLPLAPEVRILQPGQGMACGHLLCLGPGQAEVLFEPHSDPRLAVGDPAVLHVLGASEPLSASARVLGRSLVPDGRLYCFESGHLDTLQRLLPALDGLPAGVRGAFRVQPAPDSPIEVDLMAAALAVQTRAPLLDISESGLAVEVEPSIERSLVTARDLRLRFGLPDGLDPVEFLASIRRAQRSTDGILYGVRFDARRSNAFDENQRRVVAYIMQRQRQILSDGD